MTKRVLVTGMTSRQANPAKNRRDAMISWLIAEACRQNGYEVEHRNPTMTETYEDFDHVFIGLAPLHAMGSNRVYGALAAILKTYSTGKLSLFLDDVDAAKVTGGIKTVVNGPQRLTKPFFRYKLEFDLASQPQWSEWLMQGVKLLHDYAWPHTLIPAFPWADEEQMRRKVANAYASVELFDPSSLLPDYGGELSVDVTEQSIEDVQVRREWVTEASPEDRWYAQQHPAMSVRRFVRKSTQGAEKRPDDIGLVKAYMDAWGVLDEGLDHGWWHSRLPYAIQAQSLYVTKWQNVQALGEPFSLLTSRAEELDLETRQKWVEAQAATFASLSTPHDAVLEQFKKIVEKP